MDFNFINRERMIYCYSFTMNKDRIPLNDRHAKFINSANKSKLNALLILAGVFTPEYQSAVAVR